jgi:TRAP-type C4-dicarboxylate transport system permease small subunit
VPAGVKRFVLRLEENLAALCLGGLLFTLFLQVFTRFITRDPLSWTEEAARYLYVYVVFLGASAAVTERSHVAIDVLVLRLPRLGRLVVAVLVNVGVLFVLANLAYWGVRATIRQLNIPLVVLDISYAWVYVVVPVTAVLMTVRTLAVMGEDVRRYRRGEAAAGEVHGAL